MTDLIATPLSQEKFLEGSRANPDNKAPEIKIIQPTFALLDREIVNKNEGAFYFSDTKDIKKEFTGIILCKFDSYGYWDKKTEDAYYTNDIFFGQDAQIYLFKKPKGQEAELIFSGSRLLIKEKMKEISKSDTVGYKNLLIVDVEGTQYRLYITAGSRNQFFDYQKQFEQYENLFSYQTIFKTQFVKDTQIPFYAFEFTKGEPNKPQVGEVAFGIYNKIMLYWAEKIKLAKKEEELPEEELPEIDYESDKVSPSDLPF